MIFLRHCAALLACTGLFLGASCSGQAGPADPGPLPPLPPGTGDAVLFVGNSLTQSNNLPFLVEALAASTSRPLRTDAVTYGGVALEDHWNLGTQRRIEAGGWRYVVLQQGPSALESSRANLREWTRRFDTVIRRTGGITALYMVWPDSQRIDDFPRVSDSYRLAAQDVDGVFLPAGDTWREAWRRNPGLRLYGGDGFHPSLLGSYAAAVTICAGLTESSPLALPSRLRLRDGSVVELPAEAAALVQTAAEQVLATR